MKTNTMNKSLILLASSLGLNKLITTNLVCISFVYIFYIINIIKRGYSFLNLAKNMKWKQLLVFWEKGMKYYPFLVSLL